MRTNLTKLLLILLLLPLFGQACKGKSKAVREASKPITMNIWGVFDNEVDYGPIITQYRKDHPNITIYYRKLRLEEYERELINALAEDRGPDIFMVHNTSIPAWISKLSPMPPSTTLPYVYTTGTLKKETVTELRTTPALMASDVRRMFVDTVGRDVIFPTLVDQRTGTYADRIYGLPLSVDTMALYFNKDLLNAAGIPEPPVSWEQFKVAVTKLTKLDSQGNLLQSGAAIGTGANVERSFDLLSVLMMQNGAQMTDDAGFPTFNTIPRGSTSGRFPGTDALRFYMSFADPGLETYTWNAVQPSSLEAFVSGKTALFFGYAYHLPIIRARAPRLNFDLTALPQIEGNPVVNYANYWFFSVPKKSTNQNAAWDFIQYAARAENATAYLNATGKPTALKSLIKSQLSDPILGIFAGQLLTAKNWYRGTDTAAAEKAIHELIADGLSGQFENLQVPMNLAASKVGQTVR